ncbi:MAG: flagellar basal body-associated FliL family protein [Gammaproteobacteria bacterium]|nr:flagellar basal body-associated FliL family protein [Gammaproteobacteria bacterium]MDH5652181.1 flagellar basal body-associated FliL family protein [Gammaproteobacteria bacterium]
MPPEELDLDADGKKAGPKKMIVLILLALILIGGSIGGTLYFTGAFGDKKKDKDGDKEEAEQIKEAFYLPLGPEFIVNFSDGQPVNYMQITITIMSHYQQYIDVATANLPRIRHEIVILLSNQQYSELRTRDGKEKLRKAILDKLRTIVISPNPNANSIEAVYFTDFIMQ